MRIKELLISMAAASMLVFGAGCGDDGTVDEDEDAGDNTLEPPLTEIPPEAQNCSIIGNDGPAASCEAGGEENFRFRLNRIDIPSTSNLVGFNLDCFDTTAQNRYGCRKADGPGGIDNALASLTNTLKVAASIDLNESIGDGVADGSIALTLVVSGYEGEGSDDCVTVNLVDEDNVALITEPVTGIIREEGGKLLLIVALDVLPLSIPFQDESLDLQISNTRLEFPIAADGSGFEDGVLGGSVVWDDGQGGGLAGIVKGLLESLDSVNLTFEEAAPLIRSMLDLHVSSVNEDPNSCSAISLGLAIDGEAVDAPPGDGDGDGDDDGTP